METETESASSVLLMAGNGFTRVPVVVPRPLMRRLSAGTGNTESCAIGTVEEEGVPSALSVNEDLPPIASAGMRLSPLSAITRRPRRQNKLQAVRSVHTASYASPRNSMDTRSTKSLNAMERKRVRFGSDSEEDGSIVVHVSILIVRA